MKTNIKAFFISLGLLCGIIVLTAAVVGLIAGAIWLFSEIVKILSPALFMGGLVLTGIFIHLFVEVRQGLKEAESYDHCS